MSCNSKIFRPWDHCPKSLEKSRSSKAFPLDLLDLNRQSSARIRDLTDFRQLGQNKETLFERSFLISSNVVGRNSISGHSVSNSQSGNNGSTQIKSKRQRPKRYQCPYCEIAFGNNGQLKGHIRTHTGERPFVCDYDSCRKTFTRNEELTRHRRIHTGIRPFLCETCCKSFGRKDHLKKHQRTHEKRTIPTLFPSLFPSNSAPSLGFGGLKDERRSNFLHPVVTPFST